MKPKPRFLIALLSAVITFMTLLAIVGKPPFAKHHSQFGHCQNTATPAMQQK